ncbi:MAG: hypothetical protein IKC34_00270 [Clostridia bacterium]|nr:hypothetical protein [Clostridia bacterium]
MIPYNSITAILIITAASLAVIALHVVSVFASERAGRIAAVVNIALHALLVIPALFLSDPDGVPIELDAVALFYMMSLAVYTLCYFLSCALARWRERRALRPVREEAECDL